MDFLFYNINNNNNVYNIYSIFLSAAFDSTAHRKIKKIFQVHNYVCNYACFDLLIILILYLVIILCHN